MMHDTGIQTNVTYWDSFGDNIDVCVTHASICGGEECECCCVTFKTYLWSNLDASYSGKGRYCILLKDVILSQ